MGIWMAIHEVGFEVSNVWFTMGKREGHVTLDPGASASMDGVDQLELAQRRYEDIWPSMFTVTAAEEMTFKLANGQTQISTSIAHVPLPAVNIYLHLRVLNDDGPFWQARLFIETCPFRLTMKMVQSIPRP